MTTKREQREKLVEEHNLSQRDVRKKQLHMALAMTLSTIAWLVTGERRTPITIAFAVVMGTISMIFLVRFSVAHLAEQKAWKKVFEAYRQGDD